MENIAQRSLALCDPQYFISQFTLPLIIDEVQYAPILFEVIEEIVNKERLENEYAHGMFLLTGSQVFHLMKGVTQSLAGRAAIINMQPLSLDEVLGIESIPFIPTPERINKFKDRHGMSTVDIFGYITKGFYPEIYKNPNLKSDDFYANYMSTYIDRDINEFNIN